MLFTLKFLIPALHNQLAQEQEEHKKTQLELEAACQQLNEEKTEKHEKTRECESLSSDFIKIIMLKFIIIIITPCADAQQG